MPLILIKKLGTRIINGRKRSFGEFLCSFCLKIVEKRLEYEAICHSCGCVRYELMAKSNTGKKRTEEQRQKISKSKKGKPLSEINKVGLSKSHIGKIQTQEHRQNISNSLKGKPKSEEHNRKNSESKKGANNPNWNNGSSSEEYPIEFKLIREIILERDNYVCQYPNCKHIFERLGIHHIDYDKNNNNPENLITLCLSCHSKTNHRNNRKFWTEFYQNIMMGKVMECLL